MPWGYAGGRSRRRWGLGSLIFSLAVAAGCAEQNQPTGTPVEQAWESKSAKPAVVSTAPAEAVASQPATSPAEEGVAAGEPADPVIAVVNGKPIQRAQLVKMVVENHGLPVLEQMILLTAAQQRVADMGLKVTKTDIAAAHEDALRRIANPMGSDNAPLDRPTAERLLVEFLEAKNLSRAEWDLRMRERAYVRKIAEAEVEKTTITEAMLRKEYELAFGERVQVRHIQVSSLAAVERVRAALQQRGDFAAVAREMSENQITAASGGLLAPFTRNEGEVPPLIREAAFRLQPGETSTAVQQDNWYHIIKLERRFPASGVSFENADREALKKRLVDRLTRQQQETLEVELFRTANVDIHDEAMRKQFNEKRLK